jgi:predicted nucleic acid-binding protein
VIEVLDASAMIAFLNDETGADVVEAPLWDDEAQAFAHILNVAEVFYQIHRVAESVSPGSGQREAEAALQRLEDMGVQFVISLDTALWQEAARLKSQFVKVSLADCFGVALTRRLRGTFFTADRHELEILDAAGITDFVFIR